MFFESDLTGVVIFTSNLVKWNLLKKHGSLVGNPWSVYAMGLVSSHLNFIQTKTMTTCQGSYEEAKPEA